jgi:hypothetical protein
MSKDTKTTNEPLNSDDRRMVVGTWAVTAIAAFTIEKIVRNPAREWAKEQLEKELLHK